MPTFLDTRGRSKLAISICGRCSTKVAYSDLIEDGNIPGLWVCSDGCRDPIDPWRLAPRPDDQITLQHPRPDVSLPLGPSPVIVNQGGSALTARVTQLNVAQPWTASAAYAVNDQVTPTVWLGFVPTPNLQQVFTCIQAGTSGATAPNWSAATGIVVTDNNVRWIDAGLYLGS